MYKIDYDTFIEFYILLYFMYRWINHKPSDEHHNFNYIEIAHLYTILK